MTNSADIDDEFIDKVQEDVDTVPLSVMDEDETGNTTLSSSTVPSVVGEQSISGDMPDPESDDDVLENAHMMGLALDEDEEHPKPLNIASDVQKAEEYRKTHE